MDVETLKKVNDLAKSLQEQGLAANMDDAMKLASSMVGTSQTKEFSEQVTAVHSEPKEEVQVEEPSEMQEPEQQAQDEEPQMSEPEQVAQPDVSDLSRLKSEIEQRITGFSSKMSEVESKSTNNFNFIQQIGNEIDKINEKIKMIDSLLQNMSQSAAPKPEAQSAAPQQAAEEPKKEKEEIDIRKYFYSGSDK